MPVHNKQNATVTKGRLPKSVLPEFYDLTITPDLKNASFLGKESISLVVNEPITELYLNSVEIIISTAILRSTDGSQFVGSIKHDEEKQLVTISFDGSVGPGKWILDLTFSGILNNKLRGFYRSSYKDQAGKEKFIATTKFEPSDARRAFPCFDEPCFKAVFKISLVIDKDLTAVSNSAIASETAHSEAKKLVSFKPSIKMSSYLVAYMVGEFEASEPVMSGNCQIRVWSVPGKKHLQGFGLKVAKFSLDYFGQYFKIPYPSEKLDLIAIPDFASGAMENYGAITFRETALLIDEKSASHQELVRVADTVSHENAHMWFGDLVTMDWWNGLWLNEAFATFMAGKAVDAFMPEWKFWDTFNIDKAAAFRVDGLHSTRSIEFPVVSPEDARAMFDVLTYDKGCAVLRMLELFIGEETFRNGCALYMQRHAYANTQTEDLWEAIESAVKDSGETIPVRKMMDGWVFQAGYPLVSVELSDVAGSITLSQNQFNYLKTSKAETGTWYIPVSLRAETKDGIVTKTLALSSRSESFYIGEGLKSVVINANGNGFFRVNYSNDLRAKLMQNLASLNISERFNLVSDLWAAVQSGELSLKDYLTALTTFCTIFSESDPNVWSVIIGSLNSMRRLLQESEKAVVTDFVNLARILVAPKLEKLGWTPLANESSQTGQLRSSLISCLGVLGDQAVVDQVKELYQRYKIKHDSVNANLIPAIIETMAANGDEALYTEFCSLKAKAVTPQEETRFLYALASFRLPKLIERTLGDTLNGVIRTQDAPMILRILFFNPAGGKLAWSFVCSNWDKLVAAYPLQGMIRLLDGITALVYPEMEEEIRGFLAKHALKGSEKAVAQYLETLSIANTLSKRERANLTNILLSGYACVQP